MTQSSEPIHPGKILYDQAMTPLGVSRNKLARDIDVPVGRISDIVAGKRGITPDTALRLGRYFGTSAEMWMQFQTDYDLYVVRCSAWRDIAPRVRELQPRDPGAVAPVTAMDEHADSPQEVVLTAETPDEPAEEQAAPIAVPDPEPDDPPRGDAAADGETKWWSAPLSPSAGVASDDGAAPTIDIPDPFREAAEALDTAQPAESSADGAADEADRPRPRRTLTLEVRPPAAATESVEAEPADLSAPEDDGSVTEQTFEIDVRPTAAAADVAAEPPSPQRRYTVEVVPRAANAVESTADPAVPESEPIEHDALVIEPDEDDFAGEVAADAFADDLEDDSFADEAAEELEREEYVPVLARTGTDDFGPPDPPLAGPGLDVAASASVIEPGAIEPGAIEPAAFEPERDAPIGLGGLTPANWSSALQSEPDGGPGLVDRDAFEDPATQDEAAAPETAAIFDVPLPSEVEPALEGPLPPWPAAENDDPLGSLDIPDPEKARKLYEYDD